MPGPVSLFAIGYSHRPIPLCLPNQLSIGRANLEQQAHGPAPEDHATAATQQRLLKLQKNMEQGIENETFHSLNGRFGLSCVLVCQIVTRLVIL
jgi:hypothetical protein